MNARRQQGQALTEFLVVALLLVPLFLLLPTIGKYLDIAHATQVASRYAAFDAMHRNSSTPEGWKPPTVLADEVRRRFFSNGEAPVKTGDTAGDFDAHRNVFWRDSQRKPLIRHVGSDVRLGFGAAGGATTQAAGFGQASDQTPFVNLGPVLDIPEHGIFTAAVSVDLANPEALPGSYAATHDLFSQLGLRMTRHTSLAVGGWAARGPAQVRDRIDHAVMYPGRILKPIKPVVDAAVVIVESPSCLKGKCIKGPELGELDFWDDVVPKDRLE